MAVARRALVSGRVQGVFYRASAASKAQALEVTGWARNLPDGRVEVLAYGEPAAVRAFLDWLWTGSTASRVTAVEESDLESAVPPPAEFTTR